MPLRLSVPVPVPVRDLARRSARATRRAGAETGQSTAEYALVMLGAAALATLLITWATNSHAVSKLFDTVVSKILPG